MNLNFARDAKDFTRNPLGIIALFISLIYGFACLVLSSSLANLQGSEERIPLIWFIIVFPCVILVGFIFLVTKHHGKLYSPSDYGNAEIFLKTIEGARKFESVQIDIKGNDAKPGGDLEHLVKKAESSNFNKGPFLPETRAHLLLANEFFNVLREEVRTKPYAKKLKKLSFGIQAPEYFVLRFVFQRKDAVLPQDTTDETIIIRVTQNASGALNLIAIGKDIVEATPAEFAKRILVYVDKHAPGD